MGDEVKDDAYLKVSEIPIYLSCPKKLYFHYQGKGIEPGGEQLLNSIFYKELSYRIPEMAGEIEEEVGLLLDEIAVIHREKIGKIEPEVFQAFRERIILECEEIEWIIQRVHAFYENKGVKNAETARFLSSNRLSLSGLLVKLLRSEDNCVLFPAIVRGGKMPDNGVWKSDRFKITAYTILL